MPRERSWSDSRISVNLAPIVPQQVDLNLAGPDGNTLTVVRLVGRLYAFPNDLQAQVTGGMRIEVAIGVASQVAFDLGVTGTPNLEDVSELPIRGWLYRTQMIVIKDHATGTTSEQLHVDTIMFDLRAARKLDRGRLYIKFEANTSEGGTTYDVRLGGIVRALILS